MKHSQTTQKPGTVKLTFSLDLPEDIVTRLQYEAKQKHDGALPKLVADLLIDHAKPRGMSRGFPDNGTD